MKFEAETFFTSKTTHFTWSFLVIFGVIAYPQTASSQVQCLVPQNTQTGTLSFENTCVDDVVLEMRIGNPDFKEHACFSAKKDVYPCQHLAKAGQKISLNVPIGPLDGMYRACYRDEVGTPICEFKKK